MGMKTPVCEACLTTGSLCAGCVEKRTRDELSDADVEVANALFKHRNGLDAENTGFEKAVNFPNVSLVFTLTPAALIGKRGATVSLLSKELGRKIKVIDSNAGKQEQLVELLLPAKLVGINEVFKEGAKEYRVRIPRADAVKLPTDLESVKKAAELILGRKIILAFE